MIIDLFRTAIQLFQHQVNNLIKINFIIHLYALILLLNENEKILLAFCFPWLFGLAIEFKKILWIYIKSLGKLGK